MQSTNSLLKKLQSNHPNIQFKASDSFVWSDSEQTIYYDQRGDSVYLLHELAHALLSHSSYSRDIELIQMERDAWDLAAKELAPTYGVGISEDLIQDNLDTYRDWLHARSLCPNCSATGYQTKRATYTCPACRESWRVNEARTCELRRYKI